MTVFALLGSTALWLLYSWLASAIVASYLSGRKGYGERVGLASGLLLNVIGVLIWLVVPPRADSLWKKVGPFGRGGNKQRREAIAEESGTAEPEHAGGDLAGARGVPAGLRHRARSRASAPPSPARGVTLHHTSSRAGVVDHEPVGVAEEPGARLPVDLGRLELRRVGDAVVAPAARAARPARPRAAPPWSGRVALGAADVALELPAATRARASAAISRSPSATSAARCSSGSAPARSGVPWRAPAGIRGSAGALGGLQRLLARGGALALAGRVLAQAADHRHGERGQHHEHHRQAGVERLALRVPPRMRAVRSAPQLTQVRPPPRCTAPHAGQRRSRGASAAWTSSRAAERALVQGSSAAVALSDGHV